MRAEKKIRELKQDLRNIKRDYAVLNDDVFWRYEFKVNSWCSYFTHVYCCNCKYVALRDDKKVFDCFNKHHMFFNLERRIGKFFPIEILNPKISIPKITKNKNLDYTSYQDWRDNV